MPRYIDAEALYKETEKKIKANNECGMAVVDGEFLDLINDAFTEDVVPKSEVERLEAELAKAKAELAREIFEEIDILGTYNPMLYAELKKKYTEGNAFFLVKHSNSLSVRQEDELYEKGYNDALKDVEELIRGMK